MRCNLRVQVHDLQVAVRESVVPAKSVIFSLIRYRGTGVPEFAGKC